MIYFQAGGNFQVAEKYFFHQRPDLRRPLEECLHEGVGVPLPPGTAKDAQDFHKSSP